MKLGKQAHFIFGRSLRKKGLLDRIAPRNGFESVPCISYFLNDERFETKVYLQNYLSLLADSPAVAARWYLDAYSSEGKRVARREGSFTGLQGAIVDIAGLGDVGTFGVLMAGISLNDAEHRMDRPLHAVFFTEFSKRETRRPQKIISHSLNSPVAGLFGYRRSFTGILLRPGCALYLLIANGSLLKPVPFASPASGVVSITNADHRTIHAPLPEIRKSLGSRKIDLLALIPGLPEHVKDQPFSLKLDGRNILSKPFLMMVGDDIFLGDHL
jgi:hypothetical protein